MDSSFWSPDCITCSAGWTSFQYMTYLSSSPVCLSLDSSLLLTLSFLSEPFLLFCFVFYVLSQGGEELAMCLRRTLNSCFAWILFSLCVHICSTGRGQRTTCEHWLFPRDWTQVVRQQQVSLPTRPPLQPTMLFFKSLVVYKGVILICMLRLRYLF